ncbi:RNA-binding protein [Alloalcanivorax dieselolei]|uniref:YhbY family RNA-binding protein n=1 Tax=Alloalcanivorax dieselolei TaxID=285091 RepID=UPI00059F0038|nr:YhbY family RNA-binding protein [Alloalcanivorax dieselolei]GGJ75419.1 RNA-binding protein [Alloalcanivorax dieselolei]
MPLSPQDRKRLRTIGHHLKAVLQTGDKGLTESFTEELNLRLEDHELVKVRVNAPTRDQRTDLVNALCEASGAELIQRIGNIALLYRAAAKPNPKLSNVLRARN